MKCTCILAVGFLLLALAHCASLDERGDANEGSKTIQFLTRLKSLVYTKLKQKFRLAPDDSSQPRARFKREQAVNVNFLQCTSQQDCIPSAYLYVPISLISCENTRCNCSSCFVLRNDTCVLDSACQGYDEDSGKCVDYRKSQKTALLLSVFLSSTGAANFYIRQYVLAGVQLGLFVLTLVLICGVICIPCCIFIFLEDEFEDLTVDSVCFLCYVICTLLIVIVLLMVITIWWVTDLTYFAQNGRVDGQNGCPLLQDL